MLIHVLAVAIAVQGLDAFDEANLALTSCGFAVYRNAADQDLGDDQFATRLSADCSRQVGDFRQAAIAVELSRGKSSGAAASSADSAIAAFRTSLQAQYARRAEHQRRLRELNRAIEQEGKTDAQ